MAQLTARPRAAAGRRVQPWAVARRMCPCPAGPGYDTAGVTDPRRAATGPENPGASRSRQQAPSTGVIPKARPRMSSRCPTPGVCASMIVAGFQSGTAGRGTWLTIPERPPLRVRGQLPSFAASTVASPGQGSPKRPKTGSAALPGRPRRSRSGASAVGAPFPPKPRRAGAERPRGASSQALPQLSIAKAGSSGSAPGIGPTHLTRAANAAARCPISGAAPANQSVSPSPRIGGAAAR